MAIDFEAVLRYSRDLQRASDLRSLLDAACRAVRGSTRYENAWLGAYEITPEGQFVRILALSGPAEALVYSTAPLYPLEGDAMLAEILAGKQPVVVLDARLDPRTNKAIVAQLQNRTIINVPLLLGGEVIGALGTGTYGDEGCVAPTSDELEMLTVIGLQLAAAFDRVRLQEREREASLEREALRRRLQQAERLETLGKLTGGVAHDFNNLLTVIMNALHFLSAEDLPEQRRQDLRDATEAADRAHEMTRKLLALGRRQSLQLRATDLGERLRELRSMLARLIPETVEIVLEEQPGLPMVLGDGHQLDQVVMNLCLNARDAMPSGGRLTVRTRESAVGPTVAGATPGSWVALDVVDTGSGMPPEVAERIFEPFFTTKGADLGTGLGLAVAQGIVERHGGSLECRSAVGVGSTFTVTLPVASVVEAAVPEPVPHPTQDGGSERILAAEDDPVIRALLGRILSEAGYQPRVVSDGLAALDEARAQPFDLVLLDAIMPRLTAREAFERIHLLQPGTAWLFMTGHAADTLPQEFLAQHGIELIEKPWLPPQLLAAIRRALDRPRADT